jgi:hypothetical protein
LTIRAAVVARGVTTAAAILAMGIVLWRVAGPAIELAAWRAELMAAVPPAALPVPV